MKRDINSKDLRLLTGKNDSKIKLQRLEKAKMWTFGLLVNDIKFLRKFLKLKQNFQKN